MNDFNTFNFIGRIVKNCELKYTSNGTPCVNFSIAVNDKFGENEHVNFFPIILWGKYATVLEKYLLKGQLLLVSGRAKQERWKNKESGNTQSRIVFTATQVQLLGNNKKKNNSNNNLLPEENTF